MNFVIRWSGFESLRGTRPPPHGDDQRPRAWRDSRRLLVPSAAKMRSMRPPASWRRFPAVVHEQPVLESPLASAGDGAPPVPEPPAPVPPLAGAGPPVPPRLPWPPPAEAVAPPIPPDAPLAFPAPPLAPPVLTTEPPWPPELASASPPSASGAEHCAPAPACADSRRAPSPSDETRLPTAHVTSGPRAASPGPGVRAAARSTSARVDVAGPVHAFCSWPSPTDSERTA